jgi:hypothetical protein
MFDLLTAMPKNINIPSCTRLLGFCLWGAMIGAILGCNSPYIPIPPPTPRFEPVDVPDSMGGTRQDWRAISGPDDRVSNARIYLFNESLQSGVIQKANPDGSYVAFPIVGQNGDFIDIYWERSDSVRSTTICRVLSVNSRPCP